VLRSGIEQTTLEDVAREAGQPRSLVRYFAGNREEMTSLLIDRLVQRTTERLEAMHDRAGGSAKAYIEALFSDFYEDELGNRIVVELWHMSRRSEALRARLFTIYDDVLRKVARELRQAHPELDTAEAFDATFATYALGLGAAILAGLGHQPQRRERLLAVAHDLASGHLPVLKPSAPPQLEIDHD